MRFIFFLPFLIPNFAFAFPCNQTNIIPGTDLTGCTSFETTASRTFVGGAGSIRIFVNGNVVINHNLILDGQPGDPNVILGGGGGGIAGPGGFDGGGYAFGGPTDGGTPSGPDGKLAPDESGTNGCSSGGGGAGFFTTGERGQQCPGSLLILNGGSAATVGDFDFDLITPNLFHGGYGGGAGGPGIIGGTLGAGGGGGGALHIDATGTITIASGVTISAKGGSGGTNSTDGGGGGAGSGGAIWLIADAGIINNGSIDVSGNTGGPQANGARGGNSSSGRVRLESAGVVTNGTDVVRQSSTRNSLKSDISCGTIAKPNDNKNAYQMMMGFVFVLMLTLISKTLSRLRMRI